MENITYVSNELRRAFPNDLKMLKDGKKVLKINMLVWIKRMDHKVLDYFGPICLDGNSTTLLLEQVSELLTEGRVYITKQTFENIPTNISHPPYKTVENVEQ